VEEDKKDLEKTCVINKKIRESETGLSAERASEKRGALEKKGGREKN